MSSTSDHHVDDTPSTNDPLVKGCKGKVLYPCLICKAMRRTFLCPSMDEALRWLENITNHQQVIPTSDSNLSLDSPLVDQVINSVSSIIDPTLPSESEVVESMSFPPNPTLSSENVKTEVASLTKSLSCSSLSVENELKPVEVFMLRSDCS